MNYNNVYYESSYGTSKQLPESEMPEIAFSGRSNVGKSTLMNKIFNRKSLVRVSSVPGKTITVNFFRLENVRFVDLPGYGYAKLPDKERIRFADLMEHYFNSKRDIRLVVQLLDMRHAPSKDDLSMISFLREMGYDFIVVLTKADKLNKTEFNDQQNQFKELFNKMEIDVPIVPFSAIKGLGVEEVKTIIENKISE